MAQTSQLKQAERMVKRSRVEIVAKKVSDNVAVPIPLVDRGRGDPRNILGIVLDRNENDLYTICVKSGILKGKYSRNQFDVCLQALLTEQDVDQTKTISLRQAVNVELDRASFAAIARDIKNVKPAAANASEIKSMQCNMHGL